MRNQSEPMSEPFINTEMLIPIFYQRIHQLETNPCQDDRELEHLIKSYAALRNTSLEKLSDRLCIARRTLSRFWVKTDARPRISNVVAVCLELRMPPYLSRRVLSLTGLSLRETPQERAYEVLIESFSFCGVLVCNQLLLYHKLTPFPYMEQD